jgi:hypothetical protein
VRRYSAKELHSKVEGSGFEILRSTSFVSFLLPAMLVSRLAKKKTANKGVDTKAELNISPWLNRAFELVLAAETRMIRGGMDFPVGGSRLLVARKR